MKIDELDWRSLTKPDLYTIIKQQEAENKRLRELLTFYIGCLTKGHIDCDSCAFSGEENCNRGQKIVGEARELGIEVTE